MFLHSRSIALPHLFKPSVQFQGTWPLLERLELGAGAGAILDSNSNYQVAGLYALGRYALVRSDGFEWGISAGLGGGHNAAIIHADLQAKAPIVPYGLIASDASFRLSKGFMLGLELSSEQLSVVQLGAKAMFLF